MSTVDARRALDARADGVDCLGRRSPQVVDRQLTHIVRSYVRGQVRMRTRQFDVPRSGGGGISMYDTCARNKKSSP